MFETATLLAFPLLMLFAAFSDLLTMTIPNRVSLILIGAYFMAALYLRLPMESIAWHMSCAVAMLLLCLLLFHLGWIGGGDAKLAASTALWLGWSHLMDYGIVASLVGGVLTLIIIELRRRDLPQKLLSLKFLARLADRGEGVPYGVALAIAGLVVYPQTLVWSRLAGV
jgi:prepilin peptidase CpaA